MCGRYTLSTDVSKLARWFKLPVGNDAAQQMSLFGRFNVAPSQPVPIVRLNPQSGATEMVPVRWGLIPPWTDDPTIGNRMVNARAESVATKPAFRRAWQNRRCLIPSDGFYEWQTRDRTRQPFHIRMADNAPMAFAGLWESWTSPEGETIESCTVITTDANELVAPIHHRMPVVIDPADYGRYLHGEPNDAADLLRPYPADAMMAIRVSTLVNDPKNEDPRCIEPTSEGGLLWDDL